jgi:hypothetical protein
MRSLCVSFFKLMSVGLVSHNVLPTGVRRHTESWPDVKDKKFVRMLKGLMRRRHNCPADLP